ncbi:hypothetical protein [Nitrosopumilus ureiphilus]|nr:hypothetical protein [Nitrosopumilus ureiphilus]
MCTIGRGLNSKASAGNMVDIVKENAIRRMIEIEKIFFILNFIIS